ncbi:MAG: Coenzyme F420 hydrogenase/dehydrogenase, beta subunit C-terminal domain [Bacilli bacterium]|nr:Coenzyme F420 hydrogenase/dehydrogenase, beta subunit C-terminal domain [Bacilli bacterium]
MKQEFYAVKNKNDTIRLNSSSGGVFFTLANYIIENGGVVYGAIYDDNLNVVHSRIDNPKDLKKTHGSKYTQSNIGNCYNMVKKDLIDGKKVLFSGTPCQVNALKLFLKNDDTENLILVDIICHGTPAPHFFNDYKKYMENKYKSKIKTINMRYKSEKVFKNNLNNNYKSKSKVQPEVMGIFFENNKKYVSIPEFDIYYQLFDLFIRKPCFKCPYANLNRNSDITIGDFHEFSSLLGSFNDGNGVSLVILNTEKGKKIFQNIKNNFDVEKKNQKQCMQPHLEKPLNEPKNYEKFNEDYKEYGFNYIVKKYARNNMKFKIKKSLYKVGLLDKLITVKNWRRK